MGKEDTDIAHDRSVHYAKLEQVGILEETAKQRARGREEASAIARLYAVAIIPSRMEVARRSGRMVERLGHYAQRMGGSGSSRQRLPVQEEAANVSSWSVKYG